MEKEEVTALRASGISGRPAFGCAPPNLRGVVMALGCVGCMKFWSAFLDGHSLAMGALYRPYHIRELGSGTSTVLADVGKGIWPMLAYRKGNQTCVS